MVTKRKKRRRRKSGHYHTGLYDSTKGGQCKYRSGWEFSYLQFLDANVEVLTFEYEKLKIPYISNIKTGKVRNYIPDILVSYVDGKKHLVEIKPKKRLDQVTVKKKLAAATIWCSAHGVTLEIITEVELRILGLLK